MAVTAEEHVRIRAYHLWEANGRPEGRDLEFWEQAQQSLADGEHRDPRPRPKASRRAAGAQPAIAIKAAGDGADRRAAPRRGRKS